MTAPLTLAEIADDAAAGRLTEAELVAKLERYAAEQDAAAREAHLAASAATVHHIRRAAGRGLGRPGYSHRHVAQFRPGYVEPASLTLCGAPGTQFDMSWAETRYASGRAYVTCNRCLELRPTEAGR